ncbi:SpoIVB peptidase S55 domain-containing protein [Halonatronum saccharophilum]|uniref:SpoIVB peptidase S55 domain-containing protein n=1 Tax=Halonatronum saccharophilum TaxID=150060 RepID=UPI000481C7AC|nr:SpoIVB peptidase S55 domain-containing protein [Halonatronum saccharophilum]
MRIRAKLVAILLISLALSTGVIAKEDISADFMPLSDIRTGMSGVGKTVLRGRDIEEFDVEIISVLEEGDMGQSLILIKASGDLIDQSGGIASGMSGSPIYVDDKLIGAIGYGWQMTDHRIGMVTPIEDMMNLFEMDNDERKGKKLDLKMPIRVGEESYDRVYFAKSSEKVDGEGVMVAKPVNTPLLVSGLRGRAKDRLAEGLEGYDIEAVSGGGIYKEEEGGELEAGSAVAVQLLRGDMNISSIGTLTYRDEDNILAFGHPFLSKGNANYLLSDAYIHQIISSINIPFKLGSPGQLQGVITQDRGAGISGRIGHYPNVIPVEINVKDKDLGREDRYNIQVIQNEELIEPLMASAVLQAIDTTLDRAGSGTAKVEIEIMANKVSSNILKIENLYYSSNDIAAVSLFDLLQGIGILVNNPFEKVNMAGIKFNIEIEDKVSVALIEEINVDKKEVRPGEKLDVEVTLRPYRKEPKTEIISIEIPEDAREGVANLYVYSGQEANLNNYSNNNNKEVSSKANNIKSLEELIDIYQSQKKNNQIVLDLVSAYSATADVIVEDEGNYDDYDYDDEKGHNYTEGYEEEDYKNDYEQNYNHSYESNLLEKVVDSDYIVDGALMLEIKIVE